MDELWRWCIKLQWKLMSAIAFCNVTFVSPQTQQLSGSQHSRGRWAFRGAQASPVYAAFVPPWRVLVTPCERSVSFMISITGGTPFGREILPTETSRCPSQELWKFWDLTWQSCWQGGLPSLRDASGRHEASGSETEDFVHLDQQVTGATVA